MPWTSKAASKISAPEYRLTSTRERHDELLDNFQNLACINETYHADTSTRFDQVKQTQNQVVQPVSTTQSNEHSMLAQLSELRSQLYLLECRRAIKKKQMQILESLHFPSLRQRWAQIHDAHDDTNTWLFDREQITFLDWLETGKSVYWIYGMV